MFDHTLCSCLNLHRPSKSPSTKNVPDICQVRKKIVICQNTVQPIKFYADAVSYPSLQFSALLCQCSLLPSDVLP